jgi:hypothetical protein
LNLKGEVLLAYVAGIVDGEGSISIINHRRKATHKHTWELVMAVSNTQLWLIEFLHSQFGGWMDSRTHYGNRKKSWRWTMCANKASEFLELVLPYLQLKRQNAELAIAFQKRRGQPGKHSTQEQRILDEADYIVMRKWNQRGIKEA